MTKALLLVDLQNGFCPGGNLGVPEGGAVIPVANALMKSGVYDLIVASQDWHPANHGSFASQHPDKSPFEMGTLNGKAQMLWPDHCVAGTKDAEFHCDLEIKRIDYVQQKGQNPLVDSYSAFRDNEANELTGLDMYLKQRNVTELDICGLATDYCVRFSALDARALLPDVCVRFIKNASRGIDETGVQNAIEEMSAAGIEII